MSRMFFTKQVEKWGLRDALAGVETFLKQSMPLPGYGISYESLYFEAKSETGI